MRGDSIALFSRVDPAGDGAVGLDPTAADVTLWDGLDVVTHFIFGAMLEGVPRP